MSASGRTAPGGGQPQGGQSEGCHPQGEGILRGHAQVWPRCPYEIARGCRRVPCVCPHPARSARVRPCPLLLWRRTDALECFAGRQCGCGSAPGPSPELSVPWGRGPKGPARPRPSFSCRRAVLLWFSPYR